MIVLGASLVWSVESTRCPVRAAFTAISAITTSQDQYNYDELDEYISGSKEMFGVPGFAVGIIKNGEVVFSNGYGFRNTETKDKIDTGTIFGIASCSKAFTTASLAILVDDGIINWDYRVIDHYPQFKMYDPYITKEMQIQDLVL